MKNLYFKALDLELPNPATEDYSFKYFDDGFVEDIPSHYLKLGMEYGGDDADLEETVAEHFRDTKFIIQGVTMKFTLPNRDIVDCRTHIAYLKNACKDYSLFTRMHEEAHAIQYAGGITEKTMNDIMLDKFGIDLLRFPFEMRQNLVALSHLGKKEVPLKPFVEAYSEFESVIDCGDTSLKKAYKFLNLSRF